MDQCPIQGESKTLIGLTLQKPEISTGSMGHQALQGFSLAQLINNDTNDNNNTINNLKQMNTERKTYMGKQERC